MLWLIFLFNGLRRKSIGPMFSIWMTRSFWIGVWSKWQRRYQWYILCDSCQENGNLKRENLRENVRKRSGVWMPRRMKRFGLDFSPPWRNGYGSALERSIQFNFLTVLQRFDTSIFRVSRCTVAEWSARRPRTNRNMTLIALIPHEDMNRSIWAARKSAIKAQKK
jgi:hypothetical protein